MTPRELAETDTPLDEATEIELFMGLQPVSPGAPANARMLRNICARVRHALSQNFVTVRSLDGEWREISPHIRQKLLFENDRLHACLYQMAPGGVFPAHQHFSDEECVCLQGDVRFGDIAIGAGEFHLAPEGLPHGEITTVNGCVLYVRCGGREPVR